MMKRAILKMTIWAIGALSKCFPAPFETSSLQHDRLRGVAYGQYWRAWWIRPIGKIVIFDSAPSIIQINITFLKQRLSSPLRYQNMQNKFTRFMDNLLSIFKDNFLKKFKPLLVFRYFLCVVHIVHLGQCLLSSVDIRQNPVLLHILYPWASVCYLQLIAEESL